MTIETITRSIDGSTYHVTQLPARRALKLKAKLIKTFGTVLSKFLDSSSTNNVANALQAFSQTIDENQFENIIMELLTGVRKNGVELSPAIIDIEFAGDMAGIYKVAALVIEVNYENFFTMMGIGNPFQDQSQIQTPIPMPKDAMRDYTRK